MSAKAPVRASVSPLDARLRLAIATHGLEPVLGAAYLMMDKAYVALSGDRTKAIEVALRPKDPKAVSPRALADEFLSDLAAQEIRWAIARNNLPIREYIAEQAVLIANGTIPPPAPAAAAETASEQLTDDQRAEIERLIAEVEAEIKTMQQDKKPSVADPKGIKTSWEEKQEQGHKAG